MRNLNSSALSWERCFELRVAFGPRSLPFSSSSVLCDLCGYIARNSDVFSASLRLSGIHCPGNALKAGAGRGVWLAAKERKDHKKENRPRTGSR